MYCPSQTGEIVALKKVALRRLEDGIPNQALREIKALQEIEDNQYVSGAGVLRCLVLPSFTHFHPGGPTPTLLPYLLPHSSLTPILMLTLGFVCFFFSSSLRCKSRLFI